MRLLFVLLAFVFTFSSCDNVIEKAKEGVDSKKVETKEDASKEVGFTKVDSIMGLGERIAMDLIQSLQKELKKNLKEGGAVAAIQMCNTQALPIRKRISEKYNVKINRISQNYRNEKNKPDPYDDQLLASVDYHYQATKELKSFVNFRTIEGKEYIYYYKPMKVKEVCLKCHGDMVNMEKEVISTLKELYPDDMAVNYHKDDFRGLISIRFEYNREEN
jgi:hypothetical protein